MDGYTKEEERTKVGRETGFKYPSAQRMNTAHVTFSNELLPSESTNVCHSQRESYVKVTDKLSKLVFGDLCVKTRRHYHFGVDVL